VDAIQRARHIGRRADQLVLSDRPRSWPSSGSCHSQSIKSSAPRGTSRRWEGRDCATCGRPRHAQAR
jgi:hypothetical protein